MRLPDMVGKIKKTHFLTDFYISKFHLPIVPFNNYDANAFLKFYNAPPQTISGMLLPTYV
jgi:hypothetical protein